MNPQMASLTRRGFLGDVFNAMAGIGLVDILARDNSAAESAWRPGSGQTHIPAKAKRVLQIFCPGAASHLDLWDYKPALEKYVGEPLPGEKEFVSFQGKNGNLMPSPWPFQRAGECGKLISTMLPHLARHADEMSFIHSMTSKSNTHGPGCIFMNTGHPTEGFPSAGAWVSSALGSANDNLPTYVAMPDIRGEPPNGKANWSSGFLPARHQGILMAAHQPIRNLTPPNEVIEDEQLAINEFLLLLNRRHEQANPGGSDLQARMAAYELAGRMQLSAPEVMDLTRESAIDSQKLLHSMIPINTRRHMAAIACSLDDS